MRATVRLVAALTLLVGARVSAQTPQSGSVSGRVVDRSGQPIPGAQVVTPSWSQSARTGPDGRFVLRGLAEGSRLLTITAIGYAAVTRPVTVPADLGDIELQQSAVIMPALVVNAAAQTGLLIAGPWSASLLSGATLEREQSVSIARAIESVPGVRSLTTGSEIAKPVIRGLTGDRVLVLDAGHRLEDYSWSDEDGPSLDARFADRVEVVRGPLSLLYGSEALAGVVNAVPAPLPQLGDDPHHWLAEISGASNNAESGTLLGYQRAGTGSGLRIQGIFRRSAALHTPDGELDNTGFTAFNGEAAMGWHNDHGALTVRAVHQGGEFHLLEANGDMNSSRIFPSSLREEDEGPVRKSRDDRLQVDAEHSSADWRLTALAQFQQHALAEVSDDASPGGGETTAFDLLLNTTTLRFTAATLRKQQFTGTFGVDGMLQTNDTRGPIPLVPGATTTSGAGFAVLEWRQPAWSVLAGARFDATHLRADSNTTLTLPSNSRDFGATTGDLGLEFRPAAEIEVKLNAGVAWRAPNLFELYANGPELSDARYVVGNPQAEPEHGSSYSASLTWNSGPFRGEITGYENLIKHFIILAPYGVDIDNLPQYRYQQFDAKLTGGEASVAVDVTPSIALNGRADLVRASDRTSGDPLPLTPPPRYDLGMEWHARTGWARVAHAGFDVIHVNRQDRLAATDTPTDAYTLLELQAGMTRRWGTRDLSVELLVRNATNVSYRDFLSRYKLFALNPGRDIALRIRTEF